MQPAIVNVSSPPDTTLSFDTIVYFGENQIRRNVAKSTSLYAGESLVERVINAKPSIPQVIDSEDDYKIKAIYIQTDQPIEVVLTNEDDLGTITDLEFNVEKLLVTDTPSDIVTMVNRGELNAKIRVCYILVDYVRPPPLPAPPDEESFILMEDTGGILTELNDLILTEVQP